MGVCASICTRGALIGQSLPVRQFLATNLVRPTAQEPFRWRIPVDILARAISDLGDFPYSPGERKFDRPTLFIKGNKVGR